MSLSQGEVFSIGLLLGGIIMFVFLFWAVDAQLRDRNEK